MGILFSKQLLHIRCYGEDERPDFAYCMRHVIKYGLISANEYIVLSIRTYFCVQRGEGLQVARGGFLTHNNYF